MPTKEEIRTMRRRLIKIYAVTLGIGLAYLAFVAVSGVLIPCFFLETTGFLCPGCGVTRMFLSMARLDFATAFGYNPVAFVEFFVWNGVALVAFIGQSRTVYNKKFLLFLLYASVFTLIVYGICRNVIAFV